MNKSPEVRKLIEAGNKMLDKLKRIEIRNTELERKVLQFERDHDALRRFLPTVMELADIGDEDYVTGVVVHEESLGNALTEVYQNTDVKKYIRTGGMVDFLAILLTAAQKDLEEKP
jgi:hypothetical protein